MFEMQPLSAPIIKYMLALNALDNEDGIRCVEIAENLSLSKPTVHIMMGTLSEMAYVVKAKYGMVFLTEKGREAAVRYAGYHDTICRFLAQKLGVSQEESKKATLSLLAGMSGESLEHMCRSVKDLK
ncbi:MAG: iron dependent repressor, metal binding and dimerization domain protein [Oscillospiraceae bacterium]|nr:iron dependent repressor, metal binding and dimerization domain protein [Oscillospiraceae bacterium]